MKSIYSLQTLEFVNPGYIEERKGMYLLIWKDLPRWIIVDNEGYQVIRILSDNRVSEGSKPEKYVELILLELQKSLDKETFKNNLNIKKREIETFLSHLSDLGIVYPSNEIKTFSPAPIDAKIENITINITKKCNFRCKHCYIENYINESEITIEEIKKFVNDAKKENIVSNNMNIAILGGEPLLESKKTLEIAKFGFKNQIDVIVSTNGSLITEKIAKQAKQHNLTVQVSLEGSTAEISDKIRGNGNFKKAINGINLLVKNNVKSIISMVVYEGNFTDLENFYIFGRKLGVSEIRFIPLKIMGGARIEENIAPVNRRTLLHSIRALMKKYPDAKNYLKRDYYTISKTISAYSAKNAYCGTGLKTLVIDSDGEVYPCPNHTLPEFSFGNIKNQIFKEIWIENDIVKTFRKNFHVDYDEKCKNCPVKYWCMGGCRGEAYENTKKLDARAINCEELREVVLDSFWFLTEDKDINIENGQKTEYF